MRPLSHTWMAHDKLVFMYQIGMIGNGAFAQALVDWLAPYCQSFVYDPLNNDANPSTAFSQPIIVLAVPAQYLASVLQAHAKYLRADALYIDVCSVKVQPVSDMLSLLPPTAEIIGSHPLFGPNSARDGIAGHRIMAVNVRASAATYQNFSDFVEKLQLQLLEVSPEEHDQAMAYAQGLSHYIGRIMQEMDVPSTPLATQAYLDLLDMKNIQGKDSDALFESIIDLNPFTQSVFASFETAKEQVDKKFLNS